MRLYKRWAGCALGLIGYLVVALAQSWPLPLHLGSRLTGPAGGDTGVYVWNTWVFRHQLFDLRASPYLTDTIFWSGRQANLSLHNYTVVIDLMTLALQSSFGVVAAFNIVYLANVMLAAWGMYLLARRYTSDGISAWIAGAVFAVSPFLVARGTGHFSLAAAAPLPFFVWQIERLFERPSIGRGLALGAIAAWAALSDPYYLVYCVLLAAVLAGRQTTTWQQRSRSERPPLGRIDVMLLLLAAAIGFVAWARVTEIALGQVHVSVRTLYTPVLLISLAIVARAIARFHPRIAIVGAFTREQLRSMAVAVAAAMVLLAPWLYSLWQRVQDGTLVGAPVMWRSSMPGADLLGLLTPNPMHPLAPAFLRHVLERAPGGLIEQVIALPFVALAIILVARRVGASLNRWWIAMTIVTLWMALGPFVRIAGVNTYVPTPWTFVRYVPLIGEARAPARLGVLAAIGCSVLLAQALAALRARSRHQMWLTTAICMGLMFELTPAPRTLSPGVPPSVYQLVASDRRQVSVLELPFGLRDGLSSLGNFTAATQFFQTFHHKPVFGGYLSRISDARKARYRGRPVLGALMTLSEGRALTPQQRLNAEHNASSFVVRTHLGYVVIDRSRTPKGVEEFVTALFHLRPVAAADGRALYAPADAGAEINTVAGLASQKR